ncbi:MAG: glycosyltransferase family 39 protein [Planctomycetes bacterium]|nr:glycosyltransferase family 39 protein [Planctomycetota bacterium]
MRWLLFRMVEVMLLSVYGESWSTNHVLAISALIAGLWALHPIQSEAVTYITQRTELIMTLFYLLTIYCSIRASQSGDHWQWVLAAAVSASLGMGCKESMATVPIIVVVLLKLHDGGSFRSIISKNRRLMCAVLSELILVGLMARGGRSETAGLATGIGSVDYLFIQCRVVLGYFRLCVWPHPLVFDYGPAREISMQAALPFVVAMILILSIVAVLIAKRPKFGWLLALSLLVLAPTSSVVPISSEIGAERRMYLPLAFLLGPSFQRSVVAFQSMAVERCN